MTSPNFINIISMIYMSKEKCILTFSLCTFLCIKGLFHLKGYEGWGLKCKEGGGVKAIII